MAQTVKGYVYEEDDYGKFHYLGGNRDITHSRKLLDSISKHGYYNVPILVNEKMEIIDGQGRFEALKALGLPIRYVIEEGANLDACRILNVQQTNWSAEDYIKSYRQSGNGNYIRLSNLIEEFRKVFSPIQIAKICIGEGITSGNSRVRRKIENGSYELSQKDYENAWPLLKYLSRFKGDIRNSKAQGRAYYLYEVLRFTYGSPAIDNERMFKMFESYASSFLKGIATLDDALNQVDQIYNYNSRKKTNIMTLYKASKI